MKTPQEKYNNDPIYRRLVDTLESFIHQADVTPSEVREAAMLACINYEMKRFYPKEITINRTDLESALDILNKFSNTQQP